MSPWANGNACTADLVLGYFDADFAKWTVAAEKGDSTAAYFAGCLSLLGQGTAANAQEAVTWLERAHAGHVPDATYMLALLYISKLPGVANDPGKSQVYLKDAAAAGYARAQATLGNVLLRGDLGYTKDAAAAKDWLLKAALQNEPRAQSDLASLLAQEPLPVRDEAFIQGLLRSSAARGDVPGATLLTQMRLAAWASRPGMPADALTISTAVNNAVAHGNMPEAQKLAEPLLAAKHPLALMVNGIARYQSDPTAAASFFKQAAEAGYPHAGANLAAHYHDGRGIAHDEHLAFLWEQRAALLGEHDAEIALLQLRSADNADPNGSMLRNFWIYRALLGGNLAIWQSVKKSAPNVLRRPDAEMRKLQQFRYEGLQSGRIKNYYQIPDYLGAPLSNWPDYVQKAAEEGDAVARMWAAVYFETQRNEDEAVRWLKLAAAQGLPEAQANLADHYLVSIGVKADPVEAYVWHSLALSGGYMTAYYNRQKLEGADLDIARKKIAAFAPKLE